MRMKIAFLMQDTVRMYGAERATLDLASGLARSGVGVSVLLIHEERLGRQDSRLEEFLRERAIDFRVLPVARAFSPALCAKIGEAAREADVLHTIGPKATVHAFLAHRGTRRRLVSTVHGWLYRGDPKERFHEWVEKQALKRYRAVVVLSRYYRDLLLRAGFAKDRVVHIPSGVEADRIVPRDRAERLPAGPFTVGMIGRLSEEKNYDMFLRAARAALDAGLDVRFLAAGEGPERARIEATIRSLGLAERFELRGYTDPAEFFERVHALAVCSRIENLPYSIMEAMAWCRPVLAARVGGIPDLVDDGITGFLVPPDHFTELAHRIGQLAVSPARRAALGKAGRVRLEREFGLAASVKRHAEFYSAVLAGTASTGPSPSPRA